ncbi:hypothetical protein NQZ79_g3843 [Umbelopsis isabellina]|nr:hypothetical protein NQZ79_g3843 [Umbelopsis isabellina]
MPLIRRDKPVDVSENILVKATQFLHKDSRLTPAKQGMRLQRFNVWTFRRLQAYKVGVMRPKTSTRATTQSSFLSLSVTIPINISGEDLTRLQLCMPSRWQINAMLALGFLGVLFLLATIHQVGRTIGLAEIILLGINDLVRGTFKVFQALTGLR